MPNSPNARFNWPAEEEADAFGTQIAYGAFKTALGNRIDDIVYPSLNITQRQLFFYATSIFGCNVHSSIINLPFLYMPDYEVNGRIGHFQSTLKCSATENMIFPAVS
ncbi:hypothetical protein PENTCL1PPCAC_28624, partial [Pristionchus entomophagus]